MSVRRKSREKLSRKTKERLTVCRAIREYPVGSTVHINIEPSVHKGMPHPRFEGRTGRVIGRRGRAYIVEIRDGGKTKQLIVRGEHLRGE